MQNIRMIGPEQRKAEPQPVAHDSIVSRRVKAHVRCSH